MSECSLEAISHAKWCCSTKAYGAAREEKDLSSVSQHSQAGQKAYDQLAVSEMATTVYAGTSIVAKYPCFPGTRSTCWVVMDWPGSLLLKRTVSSFACRLDTFPGF